jgi:hypothetical protein
MSQSGTLKAGSGSLPASVPLAFVTDAGTAIATANTLNVVGAGGSTTSGSGNTITVTAAGGGSVTIAGDSGSITGSSLTIFASQATSNCGRSVSFDNTGTVSTLNVTDANNNTLFGSGSGPAAAPTGVNNSAFGGAALGSITSGIQNSSFGTFSLSFLLNGNLNCACGFSSLINLTSGSGNIALGNLAGQNYNGAESNNISIGNQGVTGESGVIRIGDAITPIQTSCFIAGIAGSTVTGSAVLVSATGQLGDIVSSERFKHDINNISDTQKLLALRPVTFRYKSVAGLHYGLIAEEVEKVIPDLVVRDKNGKPYSVAYHELPALLLAEIQNLRKEVNKLKAKNV